MSVANDESKFHNCNSMFLKCNRFKDEGTGEMRGLCTNKVPNHD